MVEISNTLFQGYVLASDPSVYRHDGGYEMLYTDLDPVTQNTVISIARSSDGYNWTLPQDLGGAGNTLVSGENYGVDNFEAAAAYSSNGVNYVLASGYPDEGGIAHGFPADLYLFSHDGTQPATQIGAQPILSRTDGWYDNDAIYSPTVFETDEGYVMYYVGHSYTDSSLIDNGGVYLLAATSADGVNWSKHPEPILSPGDGPEWASDGMAEPGVVVDETGKVHLFFTGLDDQDRVIGYAAADDPLGPFEFAEEPIIEPGRIGSEDVEQVLAPSAEIVDGDVRLWFLAYDAEGEFQIAQAETTLVELAELLPSSPDDVPEDLPEPPTDTSDTASSEPVEEDTPIENGNDGGIFEVLAEGATSGGEIAGPDPVADSDPDIVVEEVMEFVPPADEPTAEPDTDPQPSEDADTVIEKIMEFYTSADQPTEEAGPDAQPDEDPEIVVEDVIVEEVVEFVPPADEPSVIPETDTQSDDASDIVVEEIMEFVPVTDEPSVEPGTDPQPTEDPNILEFTTPEDEAADEPSTDPQSLGAWGSFDDFFGWFRRLLDQFFVGEPSNDVSAEEASQSSPSDASATPVAPMQSDGPMLQDLVNMIEPAPQPANDETLEDEQVYLVA